MTHHSHYFPKGREAELKAIAEAGGFTGPSFVGQGCTQHVGRDCYGHYVVSIGTLANKKPIVGLVGAHTEFVKDWTDGSEKCCLPDSKEDPAECTPEQYITTYGKDKRTGHPKWWFCDASGNRKPKGYSLGKCFYGWNGASAYSCPSF
jgi:hypothetical protein